MIRVLFIRRTNRGTIGAVTDSLKTALEPLGIEAIIDDAGEWIPDKTGFWEDRKVSPKIKDAIKGFDLVHAWGYRTAWACAEALYIRFPWAYSALDWPKTTNPLLIDRLNHARLGICSSRAVKNRLDEVNTLNLETVVPGAARLQLPSQEVARKELNLDPSEKIALCLTDDARPESGIDAFCNTIASSHGLRGLVNHQPTNLPQNVICASDASYPVLLAACDAVVVAPSFGSFSLAALYGMQSKVPVMMRTVGGLSEMGVDGIHFHGFTTDEELMRLFEMWLSGSVDLTSTTEPGFNRAETWLSLEESARRHADLYRRVLKG